MAKLIRMKEDLTKSEIEKVKVGICPKCGEELMLDVSVTSDGPVLYVYDKDLENWVVDDFYLNYEPNDVFCMNHACGFTDAASDIKKGDIEKPI